MYDSAQLRALEAILRLGSFEAAASALFVTPSAISQRIRALEDAVGSTLIRRGQPCTATATGERLARHAQDVALLDAALARELGVSARATARVAVNADSLATWVIPALAMVPDMLFDLVIDDQDHSDALLRDGSVMGAITTRAAPVQGCDAWPLGALRYVATASPGFVARWFPAGPTAAAFAAAPALTFNRKNRLEADWAAGICGARVALPAHQIADSHAFVTAALAGIGWAMNPLPMVADDLAAGALVALAPDAPLDVALNWQVSRLVAPALAPLTRALRRAASTALIAPI